MTDDLGIGDGITWRPASKRKLLDTSDPDRAIEIVAFFEQMAITAAQDWGPQQPIIAAIRRDAALQRAEDAAEADKDPAYLGGDIFNARYRERSTIAWYIREMDANATMTEAALAGGRPWEAISWAMKLAEALTEARLRYDWNRAAEVGKKQLDHSADGRALRRRQPAADRVARVRQLICQGCSVRSARDKAAAEFDVSPSTISRDYYAWKRSEPVD
ncbi:hypothetical protein [Sphingomonas sp. 8AM]|uniref:hypothetical protein n=1 Tax=Sphingomonas sp. 8AM TaxID=2653170 RepID=UPI0012EF560A|nr:hypothetical protein [Sphingomonas sp. 8AM]VXC80565.1 hypothetical protein SPHINGO8AM_230017 [Sphingomonas sp. 8AM]